MFDKSLHRNDEDEREWVRGIWNVWFDQVFPPTPDNSDSEDEGEQLASEEDADERKKRWSNLFFYSLYRKR